MNLLARWTAAFAITAALSASGTRAAPAKEPSQSLSEGIAAAIAELQNEPNDSPFRATAIAGWKPSAGGNAVPCFWVVAEYGGGNETRAGADFTLELLSTSMTRIESAHGRLTAGQRGALFVLTPLPAPAPGEYRVSIRGHRRDAAGSPVAKADIPVILPVAPRPSGAIFYRRDGRALARRIVTSLRRFRQNEEIEIDWPAPFVASASSQLLDQAGQPLPISLPPVIARQDRDGSRWLTIRVAANALSIGTYVLEISVDDDLTLFAFRVTH